MYNTIYNTQYTTTDSTTTTGSINGLATDATTTPHYTYTDGAIHTSGRCQSVTQPVTIHAINDAPTLRVPATVVVVPEDESYSFNGQLSVNDVDSTPPPTTTTTAATSAKTKNSIANTALRLKVVVESGSVSLRVVPSLVIIVEGSGERDQTLLLEGPVSVLDEALQYLTYTPPLHFNSIKHSGRLDSSGVGNGDDNTSGSSTRTSGGLDRIHLTIDDLGNSGSSIGDNLQQSRTSTTTTTTGEGSTSTTTTTTRAAETSGTTGTGVSLTATATVTVMIATGVNHAPTVVLPPHLATYRTTPCHSASGKEHHHYYYY